MLEFPVGQVQHARTVGAPKPAKSLASLVSRSGDTLEWMLTLTTFPIILRCDFWPGFRGVNLEIAGRWANAARAPARHRGGKAPSPWGGKPNAANPRR